MTSLSLKNCHNQTHQRVLYLKGEIRHPEIISCTCINQVERHFQESCVKLRCMNELIEFILTVHPDCAGRSLSGGETRAKESSAGE